MGDDVRPDLPDGLFRALAQQAGELMVLMDESGSIVWANDMFRSIGYEPSAMVGRLPLEFVHPDDVERALLALSSLDAPNAGDPGSYNLRRGDGSYESFDSAAAEVTFDDQSYYLFTFRPNPFLEAQTKMLAGLAADQPAHVALATLADGLSKMRAGTQCGIVLDVDGRRVVVGPVPPDLAGVNEGMQDLSVGTPWGDAINTGDAIEGALPDAFGPDVVALSSARGFESVTVFPVPDPASKLPALFICWFTEGTGVDPTRTVTLNFGRAPRDLVQLALERRAERDRLEHLALHDPLTGLANRARFRDALRWALRPGGPDGRREPLAVIYMDLDDFKPVNDRYGHDAGDRVLETLAGRFRSTVDADDLVARIGGDEFAVLCHGTESLESAEALARRLLAAAAEEISQIGPGIRVGVSIGIAFVEDASTADADQLLLLADESLYAVKRESKGGFASTIAR